MNVLDTKRYGLPMLTQYSATTDLALLASGYETYWRRQRRTYLHNASLFKLSWQLKTSEAMLLRQWLQAQDSGAFFLCDLLTGNNYQATREQIIAPTKIRRVSDINFSRVPKVDKFILSFEAETESQDFYQDLADAAAEQPPATYPANLPWPTAEAFTSSSSNRNVTTYSLTYTMNTQTLQNWLAFAGFAGTAWFYHPMVSPNVPCGMELLRYTSSIEQRLVKPDLWSVTVAAESMPAPIYMPLLSTPPVDDCMYDGGDTYDTAWPTYNCDVTPPQGNFTMPSGLVVVTDTATGLSPQTATSILKLNPDGSVVGDPSLSIAWPTWHTDAQTLIAPAVSCSEVVEFSLDEGANWYYYTPTPGGTWLSLKNSVWFRLNLTGTYDQSNSVQFVLEFREDQLPTPIQYAVADIKLEVLIDVTDPTGVVDGASWSDGYIYTIDPGDTVESVAAGVTFKSDGRVIGQSGNQLLGLWFDPQTINAGQNLWIILAGSGGGTGPAGSQSFPPTGARMSMAVDNYFTAIASASGGGSLASVFWNGTYQIYNSQSGGTLLGSGTINLESEVSQ